MFFLSEMLSNPTMKSVSEIRLENLEQLVKEAGTAEALAERSGVSAVYISQIRSRAIDAKTGKPRNLGSVAARKIEHGMGKPAGWMDRDHAEMSGLQEWPFKRLSKADFDRLSEAQKDGIEDWLINQVAAFLSDANVKSRQTDDPKKHAA